MHIVTSPQYIIMDQLIQIELQRISASQSLHVQNDSPLFIHFNGGIRKEVLYAELQSVMTAAQKVAARMIPAKEILKKAIVFSREAFQYVCSSPKLTRILHQRVQERLH